MHIETLMEAIVHAVSGRLLTNTVPDNFMTWEYEDRINFIEDNIWEGAEDIGAETILDIIDGVYKEMYHYLIQKEQ